MKAPPSDSPVRYGCYAGLLIAGLVLLYAINLVITASDHLIPYKVAFFVGGGLQATACWYTLQGRRMAWSFAVALNGVMTLAFIFGAPSLRDAWDVPLIAGFVPAVVCGIVTLLLAWPQSEASPKA